MTDVIERIKAAYEYDTKNPVEALTADQLPTSFDSVNDRWLSAVLCKGVQGAVVIGHQLGKVDNGSSNRRRIRVQYNDVGEAAGLPKALFCKATHGLLNRITLGASGAARGEAYFYQHLRPLLDIEAPRAYFARFDQNSFNSMVMLGDLTETVTEFCDHNTPVSLDLARSQVQLLAKLHGTAQSNAHIQSLLENLSTWKGFFTDTLQFGMREGSTAGFLAAEEVIPPRLFARFDEIWPATLSSVELLSRAPLTLAHGDVHLKNWYVASSGAMGLSDWQAVTRSQWGRDFAYTVSTALSIEDRRAWDKELLSFYLEKLCEAGGAAPSFSEAMTIYRQQLMTVLTFWTVTLTPSPGMPDMQPRDTTLEFIRRIAAAIDDLDGLDAFKSLNGT